MQTKLAIFGFGPITHSIVERLSHINSEVICVSDNFQQNPYSEKEIIFLTPEDLLSSRLDAENVLFSWRSPSPLSEKGLQFQDWFLSKKFHFSKSFHLGSASVYASSSEAVDESVANLDRNLQFNAKFQLELFCKDLAKLKSASHTNFRISNAFGIDLSHGIISELYKSIRSGTDVRIFSNQGIIRDYISASDIGIAVSSVITNSIEAETLNVSTGIGTSIEDLLETFSSLGYSFSDRIVVEASPDIKSESILSCSLLAKYIDWNPRILANLIKADIAKIEHVKNLGH